MNPELKKYVDGARSVGRSDMQITQDLRSNGWREDDISIALGVAVSPVVPEPKSGNKNFNIAIVLVISVMVIILIYLVSSVAFVRPTEDSLRYPEPETIIIPPLPPEEKYEATIRSYIYGFRANAETYFKSNKNSYMDMCNTTKDPLAKVYSDLKAIPNVEIKCESTQNEYKLSVQFGTGRFWCTNNLGFVEETEKPDASAVCK